MNPHLATTMTTPPNPHIPAVVFQWGGAGGERCRTGWGPGSACSGGSSCGDPRQWSCTSSGSV